MPAKNMNAEILVFNAPIPSLRETNIHRGVSIPVRGFFPPILDGERRAIHQRINESSSLSPQFDLLHSIWGDREDDSNSTVKIKPVCEARAFIAYSGGVDCPCTAYASAGHSYLWDFRACRTQLQWWKQCPTNVPAAWPVVGEQIRLSAQCRA